MYIIFQNKKIINNFSNVKNSHISVYYESCEFESTCWVGERTEVGGSELITIFSVVEVSVCRMKAS